MLRARRARRWILVGMLKSRIFKQGFGFIRGKVLMRCNRGKIELKNQKPKYQITAPTGKLADVDDVVLKVHYNVQPWVGILTWTPQIDLGRWSLVKGGVSKVFRLPALKKKDEKKTS